MNIGRLCIASALALLSAAALSQEAFQGLMWNSTMAQVKGRFPEARQGPLADCNASSARLNCTALYVDQYEIDGIPMRIRFESLTADWKLYRVVVSWQHDASTRTSHVDALKAAFTVCYHVNLLLAKRYGKPDLEQEFPSGMPWGRAVGWKSSATSIVLTCNSDDGALIDYSPLNVPDEVKKL